MWMIDLRNFILYRLRLHALAFSLKSRPVQLFWSPSVHVMLQLGESKRKSLDIGPKKKTLSGLVAVLVVWCERATATPDRWLEVSALLRLRGSTRRRALKTTWNRTDGCRKDSRNYIEFHW